MKWKTNKIKLSPTDLEVLNGRKFESLLPQILSSDGAKPPLITPVVLPLMVYSDCASKKEFFFRYRTMLEIANNTEHYYRTIVLYPKKRTVFGPSTVLAKYQRWIYRNLLASIEPSEYAIAYRKGIRLCEAMIIHEKKRIMVKMDIQHFFDSIKASAIYSVFEELGYKKSVTALLTKLCALNDRLPQGACTSPPLANLVMRDFDTTVGGYCATHSIAFTRYSDDLVFSADHMDVRALIRFVSKQLANIGMSVNREKTRVLGPGAKHKALGVVCNDSLHADRNYRREVRQAIYYIKKYGISDHLKRKNDNKFLVDGKPQNRSYFRHLLGQISWILSFDNDNQEFLEYRRYVAEQLELYFWLQDYNYFESYCDVQELESMPPEGVKQILKSLDLI